MLVIASAAALVAGVVLAARADRFGARQALAETVAGALLLLGLVLIGAGMPLMYR